MLKVIPFFLLFFSLLAQAVTSGQGRFYSQDGDSSSFIRDQLRYNAFKDVLDQELEKMKLDADQFWAKVQERFEEDFAPVKAGLKKKYSMEEKPTADQQEKYRQELRQKKLRALISFVDIGHPISSFTIKKVSRSPQYPNARFMALEAEVDQKSLYRLYQRFMAKGGREIDQLFLSVQVHSDNWAILELSQKEEFTRALEASWKEWFETKSGLNLTKVWTVDEQLEDKLKAYGSMDEQAKEKLRGQLRQENGDQERSQVLQAMQRAVWVQIDADIQLGQDDSLRAKRGYDFEAEVIVYDLRHFRPVLFASLGPKSKLFSSIYEQSDQNDQNAQKMASQVASYLYRIPLDKFFLIRRKIQSRPAKLAQERLQLHNVESIRDVMLLTELIAKRGVTMNAQVQQKSLTKGRAVLAVTYGGQSLAFREMLAGLNNVRLNNGRYVTLPYKDNPSYVMFSPRPQESGQRQGQKIAPDLGGPGR